MSHIWLKMGGNWRNQLEGILSQKKKIVLCSLLVAFMVGECGRKSILDYVINLTKKQT